MSSGPLADGRNKGRIYRVQSDPDSRSADALATQRKSRRGHILPHGSAAAHVSMTTRLRSTCFCTTVYRLPSEQINYAVLMLSPTQNEKAKR